MNLWALLLEYLVEMLTARQPRLIATAPDPPQIVTRELAAWAAAYARAEGRS